MQPTINAIGTVKVRVVTRSALLVVLATDLVVAGIVHAAPAYNGMSYTSFGKDVLASSASDQSLLNLSLVGTDTVALNFWWFQPSVSANSMAEDFTRYSSTMSSVEHAIDTIHSLGMKVLLKPMLDVSDGTWRAYIDPSDKGQWFANYTNFIGSFADMAQSKGVELLSIGCEMNTLEQSANNSYWTNLISDIRSRYSGKLTYAANWNSIDQNVGGYQNVPWWNQLDYIGIDAYFPIASSNNTTLSGLTTAWQNQANSIDSWRTASGFTNKQVIFTEVGYQSADGAAKAPWGVSGSPTLDLQEQADAYHALLSVMTTKAWWDGAFWWNWETNPFAGGSNDTGFTPQNKPAQSVLQQYYGGSGPAPPPHGAPTQSFFSWESGAEGWQVPSFHDRPASVAQATKGATAGQHSLAITQTGSGFSWDAYVTLTGDALNAFSLALADNHANYRLDFDVTYDTTSIPQNVVSFLNESIAIQNAAGNWSQVDSVGGTNGRTNQTIHVAIPLTSWSGLTAGSNSYTIYFALNGDWGSSSATVFFDNLTLVNLTAPLTGDFNHDGQVDAADYTIWRKTLGSSTNLAADANLNSVVDALDFQLWRSNFEASESSGSGAIANVAVPEPATWLLVFIVVMVSIGARRWNASS
ncbi:MAG TPA: dockerin type I domain-containing protein [Lacipirellulaceae bacterium]|nr:dockerin type I domain-containing protein [Lacipirellulaceae bacterium]